MKILFIYNPLGDVHNPSGTWIKNFTIKAENNPWIDEFDTIDPQAFHALDAFRYKIKSTYIEQMTGQQQLLEYLKTKRNSISSHNNIASIAKEYFRIFSELYEKEFGQQWLKKELAQALRVVTDTSLKRHLVPGHKSFYPEVYEVCEALFNLCDREKQKGACSWIGTRQVTADEFALYQKALYWMAGYQKIYGNA